MSRTVLAALLPIALAACTSSPSSDTAASAPTTDAPKRCDAAAAQWAVGKAADQALVDKAVADSRSSNARVVKPGQAVTMDFREDRLNIEVDAANNVVAVRCG